MLVILIFCSTFAHYLYSMEPKLTEHAKLSIANSRDEAIRLKNGAIGVEHLFLGILRINDCSAVQMLQQMNVDLQNVRSRIEASISQLDSEVRFTPDSEIPMLRQSEKVLRFSYLESVLMSITMPASSIS